MSLQQSFSPLPQIEKAAISRWKMETLTGLLGIRSLQHHQRETELNVQAENQHVRRSVWGFQTPKESEASVPGHTILGDMIQQPPIIMNQPASSGVGKVLAGAVLGASLLGIPGAGIASYLYAMNQKAGSPAPVVSPPPADNETVGLGLLKFEDLKSPTPTP